jgi:hypothetical protein
MKYDYSIRKVRPSYLGGRGRRITTSRPAQAKSSETLSQEQNKNKKARGMTQVEEQSPSMWRAGVLCPVPKKKKVQERKFIESTR